jgi:hypothetical protein
LLIATAGAEVDEFDRFPEFVDFLVEPRERACGFLDAADRLDDALLLVLV